MSEPKDINVSRRLREQAEQLENLALEAESRSSFQLNGVEEEELGELVKFLRGKLGDIRLANLRARLDDIDNILKELKADLMAREESGRPTRVIEAMVWEAENERGRVMASLTHVVGTPTKYLSFHRSGEPQRFESIPVIHGFFRGVEHSYSAEALEILERSQGGGYEFESDELVRSIYPSFERSTWDIDAIDEPDNQIDYLVRRPAELRFQHTISNRVHGNLRSASEQLGLPADQSYYQDFRAHRQPWEMESMETYFSPELLEADDGEYGSYEDDPIFYDDYESEEYESLEYEDSELADLQRFFEDVDDDIEDDEYEELDEYESYESIEDEVFSRLENEIDALELQRDIEQDELEVDDLTDLLEEDLDDEEFLDELELEEDFTAEALDDGGDVLAELEPDEDEDLEDELAELEVDEEELDEESDDEDLEAELAELEVDEEGLDEESEDEDLEAELAELEVNEEELDEESEDEDLDAELAELEVDEEELDEESGDEDLDAELAELEVDEEGLDEESGDEDLDAELAEREADEESEDEDLDAELAELEADEESGDEDLDAELAELEADDEDLDEESEDEDLDAELAELEADEEELDEESEDEDLDAELAALEVDEEELDEDSEDEDLDAELAELEADEEEPDEESGDEDLDAELEADEEDLDDEDLEDDDLEDAELAELEDDDEDLDNEDLEDDDFEDAELAELEADDEDLEDEDLEDDDLEDAEESLEDEDIDDKELAELNAEELEAELAELDDEELGELEIDEKELEALSADELEAELADLDDNLGVEDELLAGVDKLTADSQLGPPMAELTAPTDEGTGELLGAPALADDADVLFSGPATESPIDEDFFSGPADAPALDDSEFASQDFDEDLDDEEFDEDDDFIDDLDPMDEIDEEPALEAPTKEYRSSILEALRKVQRGDEAQTRADVLSVLEAAVPAEMRKVVSERRRLVRLSCEYDVNCYQGNQIFHATIQDISLGGMKIEVSRQLEQGSQLEVSNPNRTEGQEDQRVTAQVRWFRVNNAGKAEAGLQFVDPPEVLGRSWVVSLLNRVGMQSQVFNQRKYTRAVADFPVDIVTEEEDVYEGRCVDLGLGGALVDTAPGFEIGEIVTFRCLSFGIHGRLEAESKIVKIKEMNEDYGTYALEFQNLDAATTKLLGRYVVDLLKLGRSPRKR